MTCVRQSSRRLLHVGVLLSVTTALAASALAAALARRDRGNGHSFLMLQERRLIFTLALVILSVRFRTTQCDYDADEITALSSCGRVDGKVRGAILANKSRAEAGRSHAKPRPVFRLYPRQSGQDDCLCLTAPQSLLTRYSCSYSWFPPPDCCRWHRQ